MDRELLKKGKILAAKNDTSVSKMLSELLKSEIERDDRYEAAKIDALRALKEGFHSEKFIGNAATCISG